MESFNVFVMMMMMVVKSFHVDRCGSLLLVAYIVGSVMDQNISSVFELRFQVSHRRAAEDFSHLIVMLVVMSLRSREMSLVMNVMFMVIVMVMLSLVMVMMFNRMFNLVNNRCFFSMRNQYFSMVDSRQASWFMMMMVNNRMRHDRLNMSNWS